MGWSPDPASRRASAPEVHRRGPGVGGVFLLGKRRSDDDFVRVIGVDIFCTQRRLRGRRLGWKEPEREAGHTDTRPTPPHDHLLRTPHTTPPPWQASPRSHPKWRGADLENRLRTHHGADSVPRPHPLPVSQLSAAQLGHFQKANTSEGEDLWARGDPCLQQEPELPSQPRPRALGPGGGWGSVPAATSLLVRTRTRPPWSGRRGPTEAQRACSALGCRLAPRA